MSSDSSYIPPVPPSLPPPPPPPVVPPAATVGFDFAKPFTYVFDDPRWVQKILLGGLFYLAGFLIVGWFFILGYCARLARNVIAGEQHPLPEWEDLGDYFAEGISLVGVMLVFMLPIIAIAVMLGIPAAVISAADNEGLAALGSGLAGCMSCLIVPISLAVVFFLPAALLRAVTERRFTAAFEVGVLWEFIKNNIGNYLLAIAVYVVARFLGGFGIFLLCIGIIFTGFWSVLITTHAFAQVYRYRETE